MKKLTDSLFTSLWTVCLLTLATALVSITLTVAMTTELPKFLETVKHLILAVSSSLFDTVLIDGGHDFETVINDTNKVISVVETRWLGDLARFIPDPDVISSHPAAKGVVTAAIKNWKLMRENFEVLCWIRPSWILFGIRKSEN